MSLIQLVEFISDSRSTRIGVWFSYCVPVSVGVLEEPHSPAYQATRADHTIKVCYESKTDRSLARFGAVIPRGDNQSTRGMDLLVVSQLRFLGPVPFHATAFPGQFPLAQLPLRAN